MSKKKVLLMLLAILFLIVILLYTSFKYSSVQDTNASEPSSNPPPAEGPELVIPETPFGILGLTSSLAIAYVIFLLVKKKPNLSE